jgi:hypothetical protein
LYLCVDRNVILIDQGLPLSMKPDLYSFRNDTAQKPRALPALPPLLVMLPEKINQQYPGLALLCGVS